METVTYFLLPRLKEQDIQQDFKKLLSWLNEQGVEITKESEARFRINYQDRPHVAYFGLTGPTDQAFQGDTGRITLEVSRADAYTIRNIKTFAQDVGYRIYNLELNTFLPEASNVRDLITLTLSPEIQKVFVEYNFEPLFLAELFDSHHVFYARKNGQEEIHIINPFLLKYYLDWSNFSSKSGEFSYEVAPSLDRFVQFIDRGCIPYSFYENYGRDLKITNLSGINIDNPGRKLFVKPLVMQIDDDNFRFFTKQGERGASILMDKIRMGETLDKTLNRILKEWGMSDGYLRALVRKEIEFDKDRDGYITPRIIVNVYVEKLLKKPAGSERSWDPIKPGDISGNN